MKYRIAALASVFAFALAASGAQAAKISPQPKGAELAFVSSIQKDLMARFPNAAAAEKAGYFRYTNEDNTGSISYTNNQWTSDPTHPSQLWFDANGNLLGADFSRPDAPAAPKLWGIQPGRWLHFDPHVHYVYNDGMSTVYGRATSVKKFVGAGGNLSTPTGDAIVKLGLVKDPAKITHVFVFPHIWDLIVWVKPNPNGAFAEKNPNVHPTANAAPDEISPKPQGAEIAFVTAIQKDLMARFPNAAAAEAAGYFRYTNEDNTGSISYANNQWTSDPMHPSQLWFDASGNLLGADFSQPDAPTAPKLWGIQPGRWLHFNPHVHYVYTDGTTTVYGHATSVKKFVAAGGDLTNPTADAIVKLGIVKDPAQITHVFLFPHVWDLIVWVKPNPLGAFAEKNPNVHPTANAAKDSE